MKTKGQNEIKYKITNWPVMGKNCLKKSKSELCKLFQFIWPQQWIDNVFIIYCVPWCSLLCSLCMGYVWVFVLFFAICFFILAFWWKPQYKLQANILKALEAPQFQQKNISNYSHFLNTVVFSICFSFFVVKFCGSAW